MAGNDWIKMRTDLYRDPKVCVMADILMSKEGELARFVHQNCQRDMTVTRNVTRNVTVGALVSVWGVMRHQGRRQDDDLFVPGVTASVIDDVADLPGFGSAMEAVGWVTVSEKGLVFPRFFEEFNVDPESKTKKQNAERQRRHREKEAEKRNVTRNVTEALRNAQRREEKEIENTKTKNPLSPPSDSIEETPDLDQPSPDSKSRDSPPPTIPFVPVTDDPTDWLVVEAEFIAWWNKIPGVVKCNKNALPSNLVMEFRERWRDPGWWSSAQACAKKFPLQGHVTMALRKFLVETTVDEILGGVFDGLPERKAKQPADKRGQDAVDQARADLREWAESALGDRSA